MQSVRFNVVGNRIGRAAVLIFDLFGLWKSKVQALPDFLRARIEEIKTAGLPAFEYFWEIKSSGLLLALPLQEIKQIKEIKRAPAT